MDKTSPQVNGFLLLNKPRGITSMDVLRRVKRITGIKKRMGHGGTLDPLAQGILPICFGQATRLMEYLVNGTKEYLMELRLGVSTDTYDAEGKVTSERDALHVTREQVELALESFRGIVHQRPPMHSALKKEGKRLYEFARQGVEVERDLREVEVFRLTLSEFSPPFLSVETECGRGVYMRSLAHDLGEMLGCGAHVSQLVRLRTGPFHVDRALSLEEFENVAADEQWKEHLHPLDSLLLHMKSLAVEENAERHLRHGRSVALGHRGLYAGYLESYRIYSSDGRFLAVVRFDRPNNRWDPHKVFHIDEPSPYAPQGEET